MKTAALDDVAAEEGNRDEEPLWLGLDLSTQSLTAAVLKGNGAGGTSNDPIVLESINFEVRVALNI